MSTYQSSRQPDLFAAAGQALLQEPPPADFIARIRCELTDTLALVREAAVLPWKDLTAATLAELRFNSIADWLPENEASALRAAFQCEINRLYIIAEAGDKAQGCVPRRGRHTSQHD
jgi:hypothetical protein